MDSDEALPVPDFHDYVAAYVCFQEGFYVFDKVKVTTSLRDEQA